MQKETEILNFNYKKEEINAYVEGIEKIINNLSEYKKNARKKIVDGYTIDNMVNQMSSKIDQIVNNPNEQKIENGRALARNINITKELITRYLISTKEEYNWNSENFTRENIHILKNISKNSKIGYEHTLEYKIKHPFVVILRKLGLYEVVKENIIDKIRKK